MDIEYMREFIALAQRLNFTAAARAMHITQPALSNHLRSLEQELGVTLIERTANSTSRLTASGQYFLNICGNIVSKYDQMLPKVRDLEQAITGRVTVQLPMDVYFHPLVDYVMEFRRLQPAIEVVLKPWNTTDNLEAIESEQVDCAIAGTADYQDDPSERYPHVAYVPYSWVETQLWADKGHPLACLDEVRTQDLEGYNFVACSSLKYGTWAECYRGLFRYLGLHAEIVERFGDSLEDFFLSTIQAKDLVLCLENMANMPTLQMRDDRVLLRFSPRLYAPMCLGYRSDAHNPALDLFVGFLASKFDEQTPPSV